MVAHSDGSRRRLPAWSWLLIVPMTLSLVFLLVLAVMPTPADAPIPEADWHVGAVNIEPSWTGLLREWPQVDQPEFNPELASLGYQLFFDPVLSGDNTRSCASCHNPDYSFSESRPRAQRPDGSEDRRHSPTLWNVAYQDTFYSDGRVDSLEAQALDAITSADELDQSEDRLAAELSAIEAYAGQFEALFPDGVNANNAAVALSAFERTLISDGSGFDRYAQGDFDALTAQQRRGLAIFRSAATRCFECHMAPTFTDGNFTIVGVPDQGLSDRGRGEVESGRDYAFKPPTLRNVVLRGPYMHNGSLQALDDVLEHYASGTGEFTLAEVDRRTQGFTLGEADRRDLIAFLYALTDESIPDEFRTAGYVDESGRVVIPTAVPSGLIPVLGLDNPARRTVAGFAAAPRERPDCARFTGNVLFVRNGESIQKAVDCAVPGDVIEVDPGVYHERVVIDQSGITLRGRASVPAACPLQGEDGRFPSGGDAPAWPVLDGDVDADGTFDLSDGVIASGNDFRMEYFIVRNYTGNGVLVEGVTNVVLRHVYAEDTGLYGVYPVHSTGVLVECSVATRIHDAGIYVGQSREIIVRNNLAYDNVAGIELENSLHADIYGNEAWGNTGGLLVFALPNLTSRVSAGHTIHDNYIHDNNRAMENIASGSPVALVPVGMGLFLMASDNMDVYGNRLEGNDSFGLGLSSLYQAFTPDQIGGTVGAYSENNHIHGNFYADNGSAVDVGLQAVGLPGGDVLWDGSGAGNTIDEPGARVFPPVVPQSGTPDFLRRILQNFWGLLFRTR